MKENSLITAGNVITTVLLTVASDRLYIDDSPLFYVVGACNVFLLIQSYKLFEEIKVHRYT